MGRRRAAQGQGTRRTRGPVEGAQDPPRGKRYSVEGPFLPSPSPQRTPLLFQAGSSGRGRKFAAENAEAVFLVAPTPEIARLQIEETRALAVAAGRNADDITFHQGLSFVVGDTEQEVRERFAYYEQFISVDGYAAHMAIVDPDGRVYPKDTPLGEIDTNTARGFLDHLRRTSPTVNRRLPTYRSSVSGTP